MLFRAPDRPLTRPERWTVFGFAIFFFGLFAADVIVDYSPVKLSILFFFLAWFPLLVLHETGHVLVATLLGWRVRQVVIGFGRPLKRFSVARTPVEVRLIPLEGFTRIAPVNERLPRLKSFLIFFAGPATEMAVLLLLFAVLGINGLLTRSEEVPIIAAQAVAVAIALGLFSNLVPHSAETQHGRSPNDGLGMIASLTLDKERIRQWAAEAESEDQASLTGRHRS